MSIRCQMNTRNSYTSFYSTLFLIKTNHLNVLILEKVILARSRPYLGGYQNNHYSRGAGGVKCQPPPPLHPFSKTIRVTKQRCSFLRFKKIKNNMSIVAPLLNVTNGDIVSKSKIDNL